MSKINASRIKRIGAYILLLSVLAAFFAITISAYTNYADPKSTDWINNAKISGSGGITNNNGTVVTNFISVNVGDVVRVKGIILGDEYNTAAYTTSKAIYSASKPTFNGLSNGIWTATLNNDVYTFTIDSNSVGYIRFSGSLVNTASNVIITINEGIPTAQNYGFINYGQINQDGYLLWAESSNIAIGSVLFEGEQNQNFVITLGGYVADDVDTAMYINYIYDTQSESFTPFETQTHGNITVNVTKTQFSSNRVYIYVVSGQISDWNTYPDGWENNALGVLCYRIAQSIINSNVTGNEAAQFVLCQQTGEKTINQMYDDIAAIKNDITTIVNYEYVAEAPILQPSEQEQEVLGDIQELEINEKIDEIKVLLDAALDIVGFTVAGTTMKTVIDSIISIQAVLVLVLIAGALLIIKVLIT